MTLYWQPEQRFSILQLFQTQRSLQVLRLYQEYSVGQKVLS